MADFKKYQPRGSDGKYMSYGVIIRAIKSFFELWLKKN